MEEFRPLIVDAVVLNLLNNRMLTLSLSWEPIGGSDEQRKVFFPKFEERQSARGEPSHLWLQNDQSARCIELQGRLLAKCVTGEIEEYPPFLVR